MEDNAKKPKMATIRERLQPDTLLKIMFESSEKDQQQEPPRFLIAYWSIRGLGAPIRAMLHAAQVNHEVALYDLTDAPGDSGFEMKTYLADKKWLREEFDYFMNLPFLVDSKHEMVLAQTNAIFQHLARELNMTGNNKDDPVEQAKIDEMLCEAMDLRDKLVAFCYRTDGSKEKAQETMKKAHVHFRKFEAHLAKQYPDCFHQNLEPKSRIVHLIPGAFTAPDFHLWELLDQYEGLCKRHGLPLWADKGAEQATPVNFHARPDIKAQDRLYPHLEEFRVHFMLLPENANYIGSYLHLEIPCNNCSAKHASCFQDCRPYTRGQEAPWRNKGVVEVRYKKVE